MTISFCVYPKPSDARSMTNNDCIPEYLPPEVGTTRIQAQTMSELVYGPRVIVISQRRSPSIGAIALGLLLAVAGCATQQPQVQAETVGNLSASTSHVYVQPVHADTDLTPAYQAIDTDDEAPVATAVSHEVDAPAPVEKNSHGF
jgi:hypothetical protein